MSISVDGVIASLRAAAARADRSAAIECYRRYEDAVAAVGRRADERVVAAYRHALWHEEPTARDGALPQPGTPFFGRERETARIAALLEKPGAVVTIAGVAGSGKTRVALAAADRARRTFLDGVRYVGVRAFANVVALVANAGNGEDLQALLVVDGADTALDDVRTAVDAFRSAHPRSSVLVTSRMRLGSAGESVLIVEPFALPLTEATAAVIARTPAVAFFLERAVAARPNFATEARSPAELVKLCAALDGLPLALELAAAQLRFFSLRELTDRICRPDFAPTSLDATLHSTIELLDAHERMLFHRLALFEAPWTISEAEAICGADGLAPGDVFPAMVRLVDRSLLQSETLDGIVRYRYLETVRRVALRAGERDRADARTRAVRWYADAMLQPGLAGIPDSQAVARYAELHESLCCVLDRWCDDPALVLRCIASTRKYWEWRGFAAASLARIEAKAPAVPAGDDALAFAVARTTATHALVIGDSSRGQIGVERMLEIAVRTGDDAQLAESLHNGAMLAYNAGRLDEAETMLERVAESHLRRGATADHARIVMNLAAIDLARFDWTRAETRLAGIAAGALAPNEAVFLFRNRAYAAAMRGAFVAANEFAAEAVRLCEDPAVAVEWRVEVQHVLGIIALRLGDAHGAMMHYQRALLVARRLPFRIAAFPLEDGAVAAFAAGYNREAAQILAYVNAERVRTRQRRSAAFEAYYAEQWRAIAAALGDDAVEHEAVGASLTLERATELLFSIPTRPPRAQAVGALSEREREVGALIAKGKTNREIAVALSISTKTVENHLASIFAKLEATRRAQVAVIVREAQLSENGPG